jgi:M6 family metalloprotease-like protein
MITQPTVFESLSVSDRARVGAVNVEHALVNRRVIEYTRDAIRRPGQCDVCLLVVPAAFTDASLTFQVQLLPRLLTFVADYYSEISSSNVRLRWHITKPVQLPHPTAYYANGHGGRGDDSPNARTMAADALNLITAEISDFASFDSDGDGAIDAFIIVHAGGAGESAANDESSLIWSHRGFRAAATAISGERLDEFITVSEQSPPGVWCHELGHLLFNWPDVTEGLTPDNHPITHTWCLMSSGGWNGAVAQMVPGFVPAHPCAPLKIGKDGLHREL